MRCLALLALSSVAAGNLGNLTGQLAELYTIDSTVTDAESDLRLAYGRTRYAQAFT